MYFLKSKKDIISPKPETFPLSMLTLQQHKKLIYIELDKLAIQKIQKSMSVVLKLHNSLLTF